MIGNIEALQAAKYNLEKRYAVVGLASDLDTSLAVMEMYLPRYFPGAVSIYNRLPKAEHGQEFRRNEATVVIAPASVVYVAATVAAFGAVPVVFSCRRNSRT